MRHLLLPWITGVLVGSLSLAHASPGAEEKATQNYQRAEALRLAGRLEGGVSGGRRDLLEPAAARQEDDFIAWNLLGVLYGRDRRWDEALQAFARSLNAEPRAADALVNRGWVLLELRRYEDAMTAFEAALTLQPRMARAHAGLGSAMVEARGDYREGMSRYLTAVKLDPENPAALDPKDPMIETNLGLAYQKAGRGEEAIAHFERALAINPEYTLALYGLGKTNESRGQYPEALQAYRRAGRQSGNDLYLLLRLQAYMASHGQVMILFLSVFVVALAVIVLRPLRGRRTPATQKGKLK